MANHDWKKAQRPRELSASQQLGISRGRADAMFIHGRADRRAGNTPDPIFSSYSMYKRGYYGTDDLNSQVAQSLALQRHNYPPK